MHQCPFFKYLDIFIYIVIDIHIPKQPNPNCSILTSYHICQIKCLTCSCWILEIKRRGRNYTTCNYTVFKATLHTWIETHQHTPGARRWQVGSGDLVENPSKTEGFYWELNSQMTKQGCKYGDVINKDHKARVENIELPMFNWHIYVNVQVNIIMFSHTFQTFTTHENRPMRIQTFLDSSRYRRLGLRPLIANIAMDKLVHQATGKLRARLEKSRGKEWCHLGSAHFHTKMVVLAMVHILGKVPVLYTSLWCKLGLLTSDCLPLLW